MYQKTAIFTVLACILVITGCQIIEEEEFPLVGQWEYTDETGFNEILSFTSDGKFETVASALGPASDTPLGLVYALEGSYYISGDRLLTTRRWHSQYEDSLFIIERTTYEQSPASILRVEEYYSLTENRLLLSSICLNGTPCSDSRVYTRKELSSQSQE